MGNEVQQLGDFGLEGKGLFAHGVSAIVWQWRFAACLVDMVLTRTWGR